MALTAPWNALLKHLLRDVFSFNLRQIRGMANQGYEGLGHRERWLPTMGFPTMGSRWYGPGLLLVLVLLLAVPGMAHPTPAPEVVAEVVAIDRALVDGVGEWRSRLAPHQHLVVIDGDQGLAPITLALGR